MCWVYNNDVVLSVTFLFPSAENRYLVLAQCTYVVLDEVRHVNSGDVKKLSLSPPPPCSG